MQMNNEQGTISNEFIEMQLITAVRNLLSGRVNELLSGFQFYIPLIEFGNYNGYEAIVPTITLTSCECSEKERIIRMDAYSLTITFTLPETTYSELYCYAYSAAVCKAIEQNPTFDGIADRATVTGKKYIQPKKRNCGEDWELVITLRIVTEQMKSEK
jgi:hypothetical protein